ncbi:MAG: putative lysine decarboxylase [Methanosaeta sp. PtaB.Bin039]|nr:MAG: putative lysine decarboxylase [Methanosaeta sp. PtaB.Bin039]HQF16938.1 TIGR00725 family protein [Methanotrichaceae archaeon]HQI91505.1 TIGR00725 family protein [Methanotrichaceae archaeon]HQJ28843.1 TIGR00725 family protein [Methanotrichaceae archaeon]
MPDDNGTKQRLKRRRQIAVVGGGVAFDHVRRMAGEVGRGVARSGSILLCGGLGGVMEAACQGAKEAGGLVAGILPRGREEANPFLDLLIETDMGHARNVILVRSADSVIALPGEAGTLSEIALALKMDRPVICLGSWDIPGVILASTPREAVELACGMPPRPVGRACQFGPDQMIQPLPRGREGTLRAPRDHQRE